MGDAIKHAKPSGKGKTGDKVSLEINANIDKTLKEAQKGFETLANKAEKDLTKGLVNAVKNSNEKISKISVYSKNGLVNVENLVTAESEIGKAFKRLKGKISSLDKDLEFSQTQFFSFFQELTNEAEKSGKPIEELFETMVQGFQHAEERGYNMENILKHDFKPSEINKGINSVFNRLADFSKHKTIIDLGAEFKLDEKLTQDLFKKIKDMTPNDMAKVWEDMDDVLKQSAEMASKYGMNMGAVVKLYKDTNDNVSDNMAQLETAIKRSKVMKLEDIHDMGDAWAFAKNRLGGFVVGLGLLKIAWSYVGKMKEQVNDVNVALGGTAAQSSELTGNIFDSASAYNVTSQAVTDVSIAFIKLNGNMRQSWYDSANLYAQMAQVAEVTGVGNQRIGEFFGSYSAKLGLTETQMKSFVQTIGSLGGLHGEQFNQMLQGIESYTDQIELLHGASGLADLASGDTMDKIAVNFNSFGVLAKELNMSIADVNKEILNLTDPKNLPQVNNLFATIGKSGQDFIDAMKTGSEEAMPMLIEAVANAGELGDAWQNGGINAAKMAEHVQKVTGVSAKFAGRMANYMAIQTEKYKDMGMTQQQVLDKVVKDMRTRQKLEERHAANLEVITKTLGRIKEVGAAIIASIMVPLEKILTPIAGLILKMPAGLKTILVWSTLIFIAFKKFQLIQKTFWALKKAHWLWTHKRMLINGNLRKAIRKWEWIQETLFSKYQKGNRLAGWALEKAWWIEEKARVVARRIMQAKDYFLMQLYFAKKQGLSKAQFAWRMGKMAVMKTKEAILWAWRMGKMTAMKTKEAILWTWRIGKMAAMKAAQIAFNLIASANPIGLIVVGVMALIAGIVLLYKKWKPFRDAVDATWRGIKYGYEKFLKPIGQFIWKTLVAGFKIWWNYYLKPIIKTLGWLWNNLLKPIGKWMGSVIGDKLKAIMGYFKALWKIISSVAKLIKGIFTFDLGMIKSALKSIGGAIKDLFVNGLASIIPGWVKWTIKKLFGIKIGEVSQKTSTATITPDLNKETPQYATGTEYISDTGPAIVHKGEAVIPAQDNTQLRQSVQAMSNDLNEMKNLLKAYFPILNGSIKRSGDSGGMFDDLSVLTGVV